MIETQLGRRNLTPLQRVQIAEKYRPVYERQAKENQGKRYKPIEKEKIHTRDELAKIAKVSHDTYGKAKKIIDFEEKANKGEVELTEERLRGRHKIEY